MDKKYVALIVGGPHSAISTHREVHQWASTQLCNNPKYKQVYIAEVVEVATPMVEIPVDVTPYTPPIEQSKIVEPKTLSAQINGHADPAAF